MTSAQSGPQPEREAFPPVVPRLLLGLTAVAGMVDAVSYLGLGRTFVGNMTGNLVFLGFGLAGSTAVSVTASLISLGAFLAGVVLATRTVRQRRTVRRRRWLAGAVTVELACTCVAALLAVGQHPDAPGDRRLLVVAALALGLGVRSAVVRVVAYPGLPTTVLTLTFVGLAADSRVAGGSGPLPGRQVGAVVAMLVGAIGGAVLVLSAALWTALAAVALTLLALLAMLLLAA